QPGAKRSSTGPGSDAMIRGRQRSADRREAGRTETRGPALPRRERSTGATARDCRTPASGRDPPATHTFLRLAAAPAPCLTPSRRAAEESVDCDRPFPFFTRADG